MDPDRFFEIEERMARRDINTYAYSKEDFDWEQYAPKYPDSLSQEILEHHKTHGGGFDTAHDIGAGCGLVTHDFLAKHFNHVWTSDPVPNNLDAAKKLLKAHTDTGKVTIVEAAAEDEWLPNGTVDMAIAFECLHWSDTTKSIPAIGAQLKPGGTFAAVLYWTPLILNNVAADAAWSKIWRDCGEVWLDAQPEAARGYQDGLDTVIPLPTEIFEPGAKRIRINAELMKPTSELRDLELPFRFGTVDKKEIMKLNKVGQEDAREQRVDVMNWSKEVDGKWFRELIESFAMSPEPMEDALREMDAALEKDSDGKAEVCWIVDVVIASKRMVS